MCNVCGAQKVFKVVAVLRSRGQGGGGRRRPCPGRRKARFMGTGGGSSRPHVREHSPTLDAFIQAGAVPGQRQPDSVEKELEEESRHPKSERIAGRTQASPSPSPCGLHGRTCSLSQPGGGQFVIATRHDLSLVVLHQGDRCSRFGTPKRRAARRGSPSGTLRAFQKPGFGDYGPPTFPPRELSESPCGAPRPTRGRRGRSPRRARLGPERPGLRPGRTSSV